MAAALQLRWHGTEATDRVTGAVLQQFSTDLNGALFACPVPARPNDSIV
jgi:hypothetical protein